MRVHFKESSESLMCFYVTLSSALVASSNPVRSSPDPDPDEGAQAHRPDWRQAASRLATRPRALSMAKITYPSRMKATIIAPMKSATPPTPEMPGSRKV